MNQEWKIEEYSSISYKYRVIHYNCSKQKYPESWMWRNKKRAHKTELYHCVGCKEKAPEHIILQWRLLEGK